MAEEKAPQKEGKPETPKVAPGTKQAPPEGKPQRKGKEEVDTKGKVHFTSAVPAKVEELLGRTGTRGDAEQVRCKILDGNDKDKVLRRNVKGPIRLGDILMLRETEIEAQQLNTKRR